MGLPLPSDSSKDPLNRLLGVPAPAETLNKLVARHFKEDLDRLLGLYSEKPDADHLAALLPFAERLGDPKCALLILELIGQNLPAYAATIQRMIRDLDQHLTATGYSRSPLMRLLALYSHNPHGNHASALLSYVGGCQGGAKAALINLRLAVHIMPDHEALIQAIISDLRSLTPAKGNSHS